MNFIRPSRGEIRLLGTQITNKSFNIRSEIGYLAGEAALYSKANGKQILGYLSSFSKIKNEYRKKLETAFEADLSKPIEELSKGNKQKIAIIQALMNQPKILILDEPTSGLDPLMQEVFYKLIEDLAAQGSAVLMSSHNLAEAQKICHRIGIIRNGILVHQQDVSRDNDLLSNIYEITLVNLSDVNLFKKSKFVKIISVEKNKIVCRPEKNINTFLKEVSKYNISELVTQKIDLENEFMNFYGTKS